MSLKGIISISGMPGLFKVLAQSKSGFIVESLVDKKRMPIASTQRISMLQDITVFTTTDDLPLTDVLLKMITFAENNPIIDSKSEPARLKEFFGKVVPEFDAEKVYPSDIKKIINWFHLVKDFVAIEDEPEPAKESTSPEVEAVAAPAENQEEKAPKKKKSAKATSADKDATTTDTDKPAPKPRKKKETQ
ncbi:MAG TPA: DUF5606 domain-containing protein [Bacteroidia bacterium]|nr:DUF5606 domain-containing protein [Bacteroidia bacterium]